MVEILQIFELVVWKINEFLNSFWIYLTFRDFFQICAVFSKYTNFKALQCGLNNFSWQNLLRKKPWIDGMKPFLWFHRREQHFIALVYCTQVSIYWEILLAVSKLRSKVGKNFLGLAWEKVRSTFKNDSPILLKSISLIYGSK